MRRSNTPPTLFLPMIVFGHMCAAPFILLSMHTSYKLGQRAPKI